MSQVVWTISLPMTRYPTMEILFIGFWIIHFLPLGNGLKNEALCTLVTLGWPLIIPSAAYSSFQNSATIKSIFLILQLSLN